MDRVTHRLLFSSLALVPALVACVIAFRFEALAPANLLTFACSLLALAAALWDLQDPKTQGLPEVAALRRIPPRLPTHALQRDAVDRVLAAPPATGDQPATREQSIAAVLRRSLRAWDASSVAELDQGQVTTLYLMARLLSSSPGEAGRLAQDFRAPDRILELRDDIDAATRLRADWDRNQRLFLATQWLWTRQQHSGRQQGRLARSRDIGPVTLLDQLQALGPSDIDLWHRIVLEHDAGDAQQQAAANWCLMQAGCDRATVAAYLAQVVLDGRLVAAAKRGNQRFVDQVRTIIERWNAGHYTSGVLALDPPDALAEAAERLPAVLTRLESLTGTPWPAPAGAFGRHEGRAPRLRRAWDLQTGKLARTPSRADYFDAAQPQDPMAAPHA